MALVTLWSLWKKVEESPAAIFILAAVAMASWLAPRKRNSHL
jgi:hypothetical protein